MQIIKDKENDTCWH